MRVLVSWEIADAALRKQVMRYMAETGLRLHKNMYECELTEAHLQKLQEFARCLPLGAEDTFIICPLCKHCQSTRIIRGNYQNQEEWLII